MLRHLVALEFNATRDAEKVKNILKELSGEITACKNFRFEKCLNQNKERYYFSIDFENPADRQKYLDDQRHKNAAGAIIAALKDGLNSIFIFDREGVEDFWQASSCENEGGIIAYVPLTGKDDKEVLQRLKEFCTNKAVISKEIVAQVKPDCKMETFGGSHSKVLMIGVAGETPIAGVDPEIWAKDSPPNNKIKNIFPISFFSSQQEESQSQKIQPENQSFERKPLISKL